MDPLSLSLLALPRAPRQFAATSTPPLRSTRPGCSHLIQPGRRRGAGRASSVSVSAVAPRANETPAPSSSAPEKDERFDWLDQWYPIAPICDLDPGAPHGKTVLGLRVVAWHDRVAGEWRVFDDACPHRSPRGASTERDGSSAYTIAGVLMAPGHASSSPRRRRSVRRCTRMARRAWRRTHASCRTRSCGSTRGRSRSTRTCCRGSGRRTSPRSTTRPSSPFSA
ncbi:hypothetical protein HU200_029867 [Digitaria exilis]|uniref:Rieske domain-containing protein n=1 Tax=Digitaria exilis TaxID=1010633 RepID=A0A835BSV3_9POAL|nr:hypothetical protein HU200_029867 [Digitaria exilis]